MMILFERGIIGGLQLVIQITSSNAVFGKRVRRCCLKCQPCPLELPDHLLVLSDVF